MCESAADSDLGHRLGVRLNSQTTKRYLTITPHLANIRWASVRARLRQVVRAVT